MIVMLIIGLVLSLFHYATIPTGFNLEDERIIEDANKIRKGKLKGEDFEPIVHQYATNDFQTWAKIWSIIWAAYVITTAGFYIYEQYYS